MKIKLGDNWKITFTLVDEKFPNHFYIWYLDEKALRREVYNC